MKHLYITMLIVLISIASAFGQTCINNPSIQGGNINPSPLAPGQNGTLSLSYAENGLDYTDEETDPIQVTICLLNIAPINGITSVGGTFAHVFNWAYDPILNCFQGTQNQDILGGTGGSITIDFTQTNTYTCPSFQMGFNANIQPAACMNGVNQVNDDNESALTCTSPGPVDTDGDGINNDDETSMNTDPNNPCDPVQSTGYMFYVPTNAIWAGADCDGDGVLNGTEGTIDMTDPYNSCDFTLSSVTIPATSTGDCDGDGVTDADEINGSDGDPFTNTDNTNPLDDCDFYTADISLPVTSIADCDGDGVPNDVEATNGTDSQDDCDFYTNDISLAVTSIADCDGDGVPNNVEATNGTDSQDDCDFYTNDISLAVTSIADCDGDGVPNNVEATNGTDPQDDCDFYNSDISLTVTSTADCDGDGVPNNVETTNGTDPQDDCDFYTNDISLAVTSIADCDGDGVPNDVEATNGTDPQDDCDFYTNDITLVVTSIADCDGDGVPNDVEATNGTDPQDDCDFYTNDITLAVTSIADCDGDGVPNDVETTNGTDPQDDCDFYTNDITLVVTSIADCDGDGVPNDVEATNGTDPQDDCDFYTNDITLVVTSIADCDGDGVPNDVEATNGTDPQDDCDFYTNDITLVVTSIADCDGDGVPNDVEATNGTDPQDDCDFYTNDITLAVTSIADCDGDGVPNDVETTNGTDPQDDCDFYTNDITLVVTSIADCDGDGVPNDVEATNGTDPQDDCDFYTNDITLVVTSIADCDGDGVPNDVEATNGTDPQDDCDFYTNDITLVVTSIADCDGDGVPNDVETTNGTDPQDDCDFYTNDITLVVTSIADCDGDGVSNDVETTNGTDPQDDCDFYTNDITLVVTSIADCDGDGVPNDVEATNGTDPQDDCDLIITSVSIPATSTGDCDGDGVINSIEINGPDGDPFTTDDNTLFIDPCDPFVTAVPTGDCDNDGVINSMDPNPGVPNASDDSGMTEPLISVIIDILVNDDYLSNNNPDNIGTTSISNMGTGTAMGSILFDSATGLLDYTPIENEANTTVTIDYEVCNDAGGTLVCSSATVTIMVGALNGNCAPAILPITGNTVYCQSNKTIGVSPIDGTNYSSSVLTVDCSTTCAGIVPPGGMPVSNWYDVATGGTPLFDGDANNDGIYDSDLDGNLLTFDPVAAGLVDGDKPGVYTFYVECGCVDNMTCISGRVPVTLTVLDCEPESGDCTYLLVLEDTAGDGWDGASIDVSINEKNPVNYKVTPTHGDVMIIPISTNDGGTIDLTYWNGANEIEHNWFLLDPFGNIAMDASGNAVNYGPNPPVNQTVRVKLDCPSVCTEEEAYQVLITIGTLPSTMSWGLITGDGPTVAGVTATSYTDLAPGTVISTSLNLSSCEDYIFTTYDGVGSGWSGSTWSVQGTNPNKGTIVLDADGNPTGYYEIAGGPSSFTFKQRNHFTIPCQPEDCPADLTLLANDVANCQLTGFVHPSPPTPFVCYPNCGHATPGPQVMVSYPTIGAMGIATSTVVDLPVGLNPAIFTITYTDGQIVRCTSSVNISTTSNPTLVCNDHVIISLPAPLAGIEDCTMVVSPDDLLEETLPCDGQYIVVIYDEDGNFLGNMIGPEQAGLTLTYEISQLGKNNLCWGTLMVEDKHAPILACQDYVIACNHPEALNENYQHSENYIGNTDYLPAFISGNAGATDQAMLEVGCGPLGEFVIDVAIDLTYTHTRPDDIRVSITAPNGTNVITTMPIDEEDLVAFQGAALADYSGIWIFDFTDIDGTIDEGDAGSGSVDNIEMTITAGFPKFRAVVDCSYDGELVLLNETLTETNCDQSEWLGAKIIRTWQAIDDFGNSSTCIQEVGLQAPVMDKIDMPTDIEIECGTEQLDTNGAINVAQAGIPSFDCFDIESGQHSICDISYTFEDQTLPTCGNGFKVIRTWTIINWCSGVNNTYEQIIKVEDTNEPTININDIVVETDPYDCSAGTLFLSPAITDNCSGVQYISATYTEGGGLYNASAALVIVEITNGEAISDLPFGITQIKIQATDNCGNTSLELIDVNVEDKTAPIAICDDQLHVYLGSDGSALLSAEDVNEGSYDNCSDVSLQVRRTDGCLGETAWADFVAFECCDVDEYVTVELQVTDASGNTNVCWKQVLVEDALAPVITCAPDKTLNCDSPEVHAPFGQPAIDDNCTAEIINQVDGGELDQCQAGILTRTWTASDGSDKSADVSCTQRVTVAHISDFIVQFPADVTLSNCAIQDTGEPTITDDDCELLAINSDDVILTIIDDACYKIERTWTVINWCIYDQGNAANTTLGVPQPLPRTYQDDDGFFQYTQVIKVLDSGAPTMTCPSDQVFDDLTDECEGTADLTIEATDSCSPDAALEYSYKIDAFNDGSFDIVASGNDASGVYPYGTHLIKWVVEDGCGNTSICTYLFTIRDAKNPTPVCLNGVSIPGMNSDGCVEIWANDLLEYAFDNCSDATFVENTVRIRRAGATSAPTSALTLCCSEGLGPQLIEVWVEDEAGNADYCTTYVDLQDPNGVCDNNGESRMIAGDIATKVGEMIEDVFVEIDGSNAMNNTMTTANDGHYMFNNLAQQMDYTIRPEKDSDPLNGVSTFDIVLMSQHILGFTELTSPYQLIAADVNNDGNVTTFDIVQTRQLILYTIQDFPTNTSWRFVDADYAFPVATNPWFEAFPESIEVENLIQDKMLTDFVAIKIGDVNGDAIANTLTTTEQRNPSSTLIFDVEDATYTAGDQATIAFKASNFDAINGYQFTLGFDTQKMQLADIKANQLNVGTENFGLTFLNEGLITTSWNNSEVKNMAKKEVLFSLIFDIYDEVKLSEVLNINSRYTKAEAYSSSDYLDIQLTFDKKELGNDTALFDVYQNTPNPFSKSTLIGFELPEASNVIFKIYDITGKTLYQMEREYQAGYNQMIVTKDDLQTTGVLYYELQAANYTKTKKMLLTN